MNKLQVRIYAASLNIEARYSGKLSAWYFWGNGKSTTVSHHRISRKNINNAARILGV
jgi:hypothetical protein